MSYIFLQEQGEESSVDSFSDIPQSVLSKLRSTQEKSYYKDSGTECCPSSQSGTTFAPLTESLGEVQLTLFAEDFRVKTSVQREVEQVLEESVRAYGKNMHELLTKYGLNLSSRKTPRFCGAAGSTLSSKTCPSWGMMQDGACWELGTSVRRIGGIECGSWPTPQASDWKNKDYSRDSTLGKMTYVTGKTHKQESGGKLNPTWVEWLMGWPLEWTELKPLETVKYQQWQQQHGIF